MTRTAKGTGSWAWAITGVVALSFVICGVLLGLGTAWPIARDAAIGATIDPIASEASSTAGLPVIELRATEAALPTYPAMAPAVCRTGGLDRHARIGLLPSGGGYVLTCDPPMEQWPYATMVLRRPSTTDALQGTMALWVAGLAGAPVAFCTQVALRFNGDDAGIMELSEQVGTDMELVRGLSPLAVQVGTEVAVPMWAGAAGFTGEAAQRAAALERALSDTLLTDYARRDTIAAAIDLGAYLRLLAAWELLDRAPAQCVWVFSARDHRFVPVMTRAVMLADSVAGPVEGPARWVLNDPAWRAEHADIVRSTRERLAKDELFVRCWALRERAVLASSSSSDAAGNKHMVGASEQGWPSRLVRMQEAERVRTAVVQRSVGTNTDRP